MANLYNETSETDRYMGCVSISYDYASNFISVALQADNSAQIISDVSFTITINQLNGGNEERILSTDNNGRLSFTYDLTCVSSIDVAAQLVSHTGSTISVSHDVTIEHSATSNELLTISGYVDGYYLIIFGKLSTNSGAAVAGAAIQIAANNYDIDNKIVNIDCVTNGDGEYNTKMLIGDGDWELQAVVQNGPSRVVSRIMNIVLRRNEQKFIAKLTTADISSQHTGFAVYPSTRPAPGGEFELSETSLWDEQEHYVGRMVRDDDRFYYCDLYFGFYQFGETYNDSLRLPVLFELDKNNPGYILGSTLIVDDTDKYEMGPPRSYAYNRVYFENTKGDGKAFFDKYFTYGKAPQTFKMEWLFRY